MIKSCTTGHNEVVWEHGNHPKGCPVCSQIARVQAAAFSGDTGVIDLEAYRRAISDAKYYACKLRDANIEIEKWKLRGQEEFTKHWHDESEMAKQIEKLKMCFHQQESFGDIHLKMCREKDVEIVKLKESRVRLESQLKAAWDRSLSLKSIGPLEKSEVDVMKKDYFAMKKQRDELLVKVEELKNALDFKSRL